jgi:hypothetical protein
MSNISNNPENKNSQNTGFNKGDNSKLSRRDALKRAAKHAISLAGLFAAVPGLSSIIETPLKQPESNYYDYYNYYSYGYYSYYRHSEYTSYYTYIFNSYQGYWEDYYSFYYYDYFSYGNTAPNDSINSDTLQKQKYYNYNYNDYSNYYSYYNNYLEYYSLYYSYNNSSYDYNYKYYNYYDLFRYNDSIKADTSKPIKYYSYS